MLCGINKINRISCTALFTMEILLPYAESFAISSCLSWEVAAGHNLLVESQNLRVHLQTLLSLPLLQVVYVDGEGRVISSTFVFQDPAQDFNPGCSVPEEGQVRQLTCIQV